MPIKELAPSDDGRHALDPNRALMRESLVWVVPLAERGLGLVAYTWVDAFGKAGTAGIAFGPRLRSPIFERFDDIPVPDDMTFEAWKAGPMQVGHREPLRTADIGYTGERLAMDFIFTAMHPPYAFSSHPEPFPRWFADDRFEQGGRARGTARLDGEEIAFDGFCHRRFAARFTDDAGRTTEVRLSEPTAEIDYPISPRLTLFDIVGPGTIDGAAAVAYTEMAWPPDYLAANQEEKA